MTAYALSDVVSVDNLPLSSGSVLVTGSITVGNIVTVTGSLSQVPVGTQSVTGTVALTGQPIQVTVTSSLPVTFPGGLSVTSTGSLGVAVQNFPGTQTVAGAVGVVNWPTVIGVSSSFPLQTWQQGTIGVSGTITITATSSLPVTVNNFPATQSVTGTVALTAQPIHVTLTASLPVTVGNQVFVTSTGSLPVTFPGGLTVTSTGSLGVAVQNFPATQQITGTVALTAQPVQITITSSLPVTVGNQVTVTSTGSLPVTFPGGLTVTSTGSLGVAVQNFPSTQQVTGTIALTAQPVQVTLTSSLPVTVGNQVIITSTGSLPVTFPGGLTVTSTGSLGVAVQNFPTTQQVTLTASLPVTISSQLSINNFPVTQDVSGGVNILNWPVTVGVSASMPLPTWDSGITSVTGSQLTGSTFTGRPLVMAGVFLTGSSIGVSASLVTAIRTDISGSVFVVQNKDVGRVIKMFITSSVTGTLGETLINLQALSNYALSGTVASSFLPTNGKTLRIQAAILTWNSVTAITGSVICRIRATAGQAITAKSPSIFSIGAGRDVSGINQSYTTYIEFSDGLEFTGKQQFGVTQQCSHAAAGFDFSLIGFEY